MQDAVAQVQANLNLVDADAAVYVQLVLAGPAKVSDLAEALKIHRNDVYRTAERLMQRGLIEATLERPARYVAVDPQKVFDAEIAARLRSIDALKQTREHVTDLVSKIHLAASPTKSTYRVIQGRPDIYGNVRELIEGAKTSVTWATTLPASAVLWDLFGLYDTVRAAAKRGVDFRGLVRPEAGGLSRLEAALDLTNVELRNLEAAGIVRFLVVDDRELVMWVVNDPSESLYAGDEVAIRSTAPGFVEAQRFFFEQAWDRAPLLLPKAPTLTGRAHFPTPAPGELAFARSFQAAR